MKNPKHKEYPYLLRGFIGKVGRDGKHYWDLYLLAMNTAAPLDAITLEISGEDIIRKIRVGKIYQVDFWDNNYVMKVPV